MERASLARARIISTPRAARKSEWLRSALAHHHSPDAGAENEIVVLATGVDQYLQEVFHHLALPGQEDSVPAEDFSTLCAVLGLRAEAVEEQTKEEEEEEPAGGAAEEFSDVCAELPERLSFREFHARLCGFFRVRTAARSAWRLPLSEDTELVERQIRLRWPRVRRRKSVSFDLGMDHSGAVERSTKRRVSEKIHEGEEVGALRELVEDLRSALQGSDARCLALEVALRRERSRLSPCLSTDVSTDPKPTHRLQPEADGSGRIQPPRDSRDPLMRELKLIRSSRDGQLEEAIKFNQRLEEEVRWAYQEVRKLQEAENSLRRENAQIRKRAEEAREALRVGLQRVRLIQEQAHMVPQLQARVSQLQSELLQFRTQCTCLASVSPEESCSRRDGDWLQRAVEGRAASDEEEEDRGVKEVKRHGCGKGCQKNATHHLPFLPHKCDINQCKENRRGTKLHHEEVKGHGDADTEKTLNSLSDKSRQQETQKRRLSSLENKFKDSLSLLLQLHSKSASHRILEKLATDSLDACSRSAGTTSSVDMEGGMPEQNNICLRLQGVQPAAAALRLSLVKSAN